MNEDSIIEKIRSLLRLAKSDNAHEANPSASKPPSTTVNNGQPR